MKYSVEMTDDEYRRIENAERLGFDVSGFFRARVSELPPITPLNSPLTYVNGNGNEAGTTATPPVAVKEENTWDRHVRESLEAFERATPEEREEADRELETLKNALNAERDRAGARRLY